FISPAGGGTHTVRFGDGNISSIVVNTGNQDFTVEINQTLASAPVTVNLGNGKDNVAVSPATANLNGIQGAITGHTGGGTDTLTVDDEFNTDAQTYILGPSLLSRSGAAPITYGQGMNYVGIHGSQGNNTYNVSGTEPTYDTTLFTGNGQDVVNVN